MPMEFSFAVKFNFPRVSYTSLSKEIDGVFCRGCRRVPEGRSSVRADRVGRMHDLEASRRARSPAELCHRQVMLLASKDKFSVG